ESPTLSTLTVNGALAIETACVLKFSALGFNAINGAVPVPRTGTNAGFTDELFQIRTFALLTPVLPGANRTLIVPLAPGSTTPFVNDATIKSLPTEISTLVTTKAALPPFVNVIERTVLVVPTG